MHLINCHIKNKFYAVSQKIKHPRVKKAIEKNLKIGGSISY